MSNYSKTTNFASKDALLSGNPSKVVNGTELNTEFDDISTAIATKIEGASPTFTGTVTTATLATTVDDANNAAVVTPFTLTHTTSGTPGAGIGVGLNFVAETAASNNEIGASIRAVTTDVGAGTEDFDLVVNLMKAGAAASEALRVSSTGVVTTTGSVVSDTDSTDSLGTTGVRWANAYVDDVTVTTNIVVGGTVDGRDVATDGIKLDTVETSADVTDATNVNAAGAVMNTDATTAAMSFVVDEDNMVSNLATKVPTQQSTKAYVDAQLIAANGLAGALLIGASTGGTDIVVTALDKITTDTIAETTAAAGVTIDSVLVKDNTVTATTFVGALTGTASGNLVSGGALGTPSSGVMTNVTGTAAGLTAGNVTTNANLTGHVTSVGNAAVLGSFTLAQLNTAISDATAAILGANTFTGLQTLSTGADIASATAVDLTAATGNTVVITGTTASTSLTMTAGQQMVLLPSGAWPLTYHATTMNINGGVDYTCAAGDRIEAFKDLAGVIRVNVVKQDGTAVVAGGAAGLTFLSKVTAATSATVDIETTFDGTYDAYLLVASGVTFSSAGTRCYCRLKIGGSYLTTGTYNWHTNQSVSGGAGYAGRNAISATQIEIIDAIGGAAGDRVDFQLHLSKPDSTSLQKGVWWEGGANIGTGIRIGSGYGGNTGTSALTGIQFYGQAGNILLGDFRLYGITNS